MNSSFKEKVFKGDDNRHYYAADSTYTDNETLILNHQNTFGVFDRRGDIQPFGKTLHGLYHEGTRYINNLEFRVEGARPMFLSSSLKSDNEILSVDLTNPTLYQTDGTEIRESEIHISRKRLIKNGVAYERFKFMKYSGSKIQLNISLKIDGDFKDIFEIRGAARSKNGEKKGLKLSVDKWSLGYIGADEIEREALISFSETPIEVTDNTFSFVIPLNVKEVKEFELSIQFLTSNSQKTNFTFEEASALMGRKVNDYKSLIGDVFTSNEQFNHWINRSKTDLLSLIAETEHGKYPYAGVPWYNTAFGRDGIITAIQTLWIAPRIAKDVLIFVAKTQATEHDKSKDAEPGKIFHEFRGGEMANTGEIPFDKYYGTVDATPLFIILAGMYFRRTNDSLLIKEIWENLILANKWVDVYGDSDNDGFVEYQRQSENGLINQGWKDSHDSIQYEDGTLASGSVALCEVQAYVYQAKRELAHIARAFNDDKFADVLTKQANDLKKSFNEKFWNENLGCYVIALDGNKKQCKTISSNAGHALLTEIADKNKAQKVAQKLLSDEMYTGWGIRTLSQNEEAYNPISYHNGSVWPHDNSLIAYGFSKYGMSKEVNKIISGLFDASLFIEHQRLPELFCGFNRRTNEGPTRYPVACSPQAWAVATAFLLLKATLRLEIDAINKRVTFDNPSLPDFLDRLTIKKLELSDNEFLSIELYRYQYDIGFNVIQRPHDWEINIKK